MSYKLILKDKIKDCFDLTNQLASGLNNQCVNRDIAGKLLMLVRELYQLLPSTLEETKNALKSWDKNFSQYNYIQLPYCLGHIQGCLQVLLDYPIDIPAKKIFISHSSKDKDIVDAFVTLLCMGGGFSPNDIFCTSIEGMKIKNGEDIRQHIQNNVNFADFAILLISPNYKQSEICLNEMGAVWAINKKVKTYVLPGLKESKVGWLIDTKAAEKINDMTALASLYDTFVRFYNLSGNTELWTAQAMKFCNTLKNIYKEFESSVTNTQASRGEKSELVINVINSFPGTFTVRQIEQQCPGVCRELIRKIMKQHDSCLECTGKGPAVVWKRVKVLPFREDNSKGNIR